MVCSSCTLGIHHPLELKIFWSSRTFGTHPSLYVKVLWAWFTIISPLFVTKYPAEKFELVDLSALATILVSLFLDELVEDVDGHGEDDGGVVLRWYCTQGLQVPQLEQSGYCAQDLYVPLLKHRDIVLRVCRYRSWNTVVVFTPLHHFPFSYLQRTKNIGT